MSWLRQFLSRLCALFTRNQLDAEMAEEIRQHLEVRTRRNIEAGMEPDEARFAAQREFGGVEQVKELVRDNYGWAWAEQLRQDFLYGVRVLRKSPIFTAVVVLSLGIGIGANAVVFSLVNSLLLRPLPVPNPYDIVLFSWQVPQMPGVRPWDSITGPNGLRGSGFNGKEFYVNNSFSLLALDRVRQNSQTLSMVFALFPERQLNVNVGGYAEVSEIGLYVSGNYHRALGVRPALGRILQPEDDQPSASPVATISHRYWRQRFGSDPAAVGSAITINGSPFTIVGVTPPDFRDPLEEGNVPDLSFPMAKLAGADWLDPARNNWFLRIMGRLGPGITLAQAQAELEALFRASVMDGLAAMALERAGVQPDLNRIPRFRLEHAGFGIPNAVQYSRSIGTLLALAGVILVIACVNIACLLLARGTARRREIAMRKALGAGRGRLIRQLMTESGLLACLGGLLGVALSVWGIDLFSVTRPLGWWGPPDLGLEVDWRVLGFTFLLSLFASLLCGVAPALSASRADLTSQFHGRSEVRGASPLARGMLVAQITLSLVLLVSASLLVGTIHNLRRVDVGFQRDNLLLFQIDATVSGRNGASFADLHQRIAQTFEQLPGVRSVTYSSFPLLTGGGGNRPLSIQGRESGRADFVQTNAVRWNFLSALGIPVLRGRDFTSRDDEFGAKVAIISQAVADKYFPGEDPVGRRFGLNGPTTADQIEIVGVVRDARHRHVRVAAPPTIYLSFMSPHLRMMSPYWGQLQFAVRTEGTPTGMAAAVREAMRKIDGNLPITDLRTLDEQTERLFAPERLLAEFSAFFGALALALVCIGLYATMSFSVVRRTREIGIRMALGALPRQVLLMILGEVQSVVVIGAVLGCFAAIAVARFIGWMLFGLSPTEPMAYLLAAILLVMVGTVAALIPARRAAKVDPMVALRCE